MRLPDGVVIPSSQRTKASHNPFAPRRGLRSASFLESGTTNSTVATLLQIGLPSRRVAQEVVEREELDILTVSGLRAWLREHSHEPETRWNYLDAAIRPLWVSFVADSTAAETGAWGSTTNALRLSEYGGLTIKPPVSGLLRRVVVNDETFGEFQAPDGTPIGRTEWPLGNTGSHFATATLQSNGIVNAIFISPTS